MNKRVLSLALATVVVIGSVAIADEGGGNAGWRGGRTTTVNVRTNAAESGLVGIKLYDTGIRVVALYGTPDDVQAVGAGGGAVGPVGGGAGGPAGTNSGAGGGAGGASQATADALHRPFSFGDEMLNLRQMVPDSNPSGASTPGGGGPAPTGGGRGPGAAPGGGGAAGGGGGNAGRIMYTRWIYNRGPSRYGFVLDNSNRVVQIEAIGSSDGRVTTNRGIRFGSNFADIIRRYGDPDGYEIAADTIVVRYLVKWKCAFRLNRLTAGKPHVVTGVVIAAGKA